MIELDSLRLIINQYLAETRDVDYQKNRLLFRNNIQRIGELEAYEISKQLDYETKDVTTPLGISQVNVPADKIVLATIFRAGLPFHNGFLNLRPCGQRLRFCLPRIHRRGTPQHWRSCRIFGYTKHRR